MPSRGMRPTICPVGRVVPTPAGPHRREKVRMLRLRPPVRPVGPPVQARDEAREESLEGEAQVAAAAAANHCAANETCPISRILKRSN